MKCRDAIQELIKDNGSKLQSHLFVSRKSSSGILRIILIYQNQKLIRPDVAASVFA
jgi:hypothetical protein